MRTAEVGSATAPAAVTGLVAGPSATLLTFRRPGTGEVGDVALAGTPDRAAATLLTAALRRVAWVAVDVSGPAVACSVMGISRRPRKVAVSLGAALSLIRDGVPAVVRTAAGAAR